MRTKHFCFTWLIQTGCLCPCCFHMMMHVRLQLRFYLLLLALVLAFYPCNLDYAAQMTSLAVSMWLQMVGACLEQCHPVAGQAACIADGHRIW